MTTPARDTCRHCGRPIERESGNLLWRDDTRDPLFCPHALTYCHSPAMREDNT